MRHIGVRICESPDGGRLLGWVSVRVGGKRGLADACRRGFHSVVTGRDRLGCLNVPGVLAAAEPGAEPDRGRISVSRDNKLLHRPRQVSFGIRRLPLTRVYRLRSIKI